MRERQPEQGLPPRLRRRAARLEIDRIGAVPAAEAGERVGDEPGVGLHVRPVAQEPRRPGVQARRRRPRARMITQLTIATGSARYSQASRAQRCGSASSQRRSTVSRQRRRSSWTTSRTGWTCSARRAGERRLALLEEGGDAFGEVGRRDELGLRPRLRLELLLERRGLGRVEQALRLPDGARRHRREELGDLAARARRAPRRARPPRRGPTAAPRRRSTGGRSSATRRRARRRAAGGRTRLPPVSGTSPMPTKAGTKLASSEAIRTSQASASDSPPRLPAR